MTVIPVAGARAGPPGPAAAARPDAAAPRRPLAQALALCGGVLRRAAALRRAGPGGTARADVLGDLGPRAAARCGSARGCGCPARAARSGPRRADGEEGSIDYAPDEGSLVRIEASLAERRGAGLPALRRRPVGGGRVPHRRGRVRVDPKAGRRAGEVRRPDRRAPLAGRGARDGGRVGRLPPAPHGLELVGRRRPHRRRALGRLEPGQRHQRPARALRAGDLGGRRAVRAGPGRASRASRRSPSTTAPAWRSAASASGESRRTACSSATRTGSRSAASRAPSRAGSSSSAASASWSTTTPTGEAAARRGLAIRRYEWPGTCQRQGGSSPGGKS